MAATGNCPEEDPRWGGYGYRGGAAEAWAETAGKEPLREARCRASSAADRAGAEAMGAAGEAAAAAGVTVTFGGVETVVEVRVRPCCCCTAGSEEAECDCDRRFPVVVGGGGAGDVGRCSTSDCCGCTATGAVYAPAASGEEGVLCRFMAAVLKTLPVDRDDCSGVSGDCAGGEALTGEEVLRGPPVPGPEPWT
mmetsp:Transcript_13530/g.53640  ORF Transcript_13530/g.53640 Transcript_13530/m.53640 type:complete len:194 (-) Transcript_13530:3520-4101(-)